MISSIKSDEYEFTIRETRTKDIINQVANMLSRSASFTVRLQQGRRASAKMLREKQF